MGASEASAPRGAERRSGRARARRAGIPAAAAAALALVLAPTEGWTGPGPQGWWGGAGSGGSGGRLGLDQRDVRVLDAFGDASADDHATPHPSFPGFVGAELAVWKAAVEWGSELHGDGQGDPTQPDGLGSGGANFDPSWQGRAPDVGGPGDNVHSEIAGSNGPLLAYCETPAGDGWRIRYYAGWTWDDDPAGAVSPAVDLQGVATHEYGHALGLGHSSDIAATMYPAAFGSGVSLRSLAPSDAASLQALYGAKDPGKPRILGVTVQGGTLTIDGSGFSIVGNEVWFTRAASAGPGDGTPVRVTGLLSTGNKSRLVLAIPPEAGPGDVLVKRFGTGHAALSNAWPLDPTVDGTSGGPPSILSFEPAQVQAVAPGPAGTGDPRVRVHGSGFASAVDVTLGGLPATPGSWTAVGDTVLDVDLPPPAALGPVAVVVTNDAGSSAPASFVFVANEPPALSLRTPDVYSSLPLEVVLGGTPGDPAFVALSPAASPTSVPGVVELAIGAQLSSLFLVATPVVGPAGWSEVVLPLAGLAYGTPLHLQAATFDASSGALPLVSTNVVTATFWF